MRFSQLYAPTVKEAPADAEVVSHALLYRAGFIRKAAAGVYTYLPLAKRTLSKIENIIREEMNKDRGSRDLHAHHSSRGAVADDGTLGRLW